MRLGLGHDGGRGSSAAVKLYLGVPRGGCAQIFINGNLARVLLATHKIGTLPPSALVLTPE